MKLVFYLLLLSQAFVVSVEGLRIPEEWTATILSLCQNFDARAQTLITAPQPSPTITENSDNAVQMLCPRILLWSPLEQFQSFLLSVVVCAVCKAAGNNSGLIPSRWQDGSSERHQPRKIHDSRGIVLLVSRVYKCVRGHEILGHDPSVLLCVPKHLQPFLLWHKTGVTKQLVEDISTFVETGIPILSIESLLLKQYRKDYIRHTMISSQGLTHSFETWSSLFPSATPSWHLIKTCFQVDFAQKGDLYTKHMQQMTIDNGDGWLSCDYTFASAGNLKTIAFNDVCT